MSDAVKRFDGQVKTALASDGGLDRGEAGALQTSFRGLLKDPKTQLDAVQWASTRASPHVRDLLLGGSYDTYRGPRAQPMASAEPSSLRGAPALRDALQDTPREVRDNYRLSLSDDRSTLTVDPPPTGFRGATRSMAVTDSANGGKEMRLEGGPFDKGQWVSGTFRSMIEQRLGPERAREALQRLHRADFGLDTPRDFLVVNGERDRNPTMIAFARGENRGAVTICDEVAVHDFNGRGGVVMRKPVVYLYPQQRQRVRVEVWLRGSFTAQYPKPNRGSSAGRAVWEVMAAPDGALFVPETDRGYGYLFWEGTAPSFVLDPAQAHCVAGAECETFLEGATRRLGLNDRERTDFISYWLPHLEQNPHNLIQFLDEATYEQYAGMHVTPEPEHVLRVFMIFRGLAEAVPAGAPELPLGKRGGFTVVEWGGANLDERGG